MRLEPGSDNKFYLYPSRYCMGLLLLMHVAAMLCVFALPLKWWAYLLIAIVLLASLIYYIELSVRYRLKRSIRNIEYKNDQRWLLTDARQSCYAKLLGESVVTRYMLILNFRLIDRKTRRTVIVFRDALTAEAFRKLRLLSMQKQQ